MLIAVLERELNALGRLAVSRQHGIEGLRWSDGMDQEKFEAEAVAQYWFTEPEEILVVADPLVENGNYSYALFFGHPYRIQISQFQAEFLTPL